MANSLTKLVAGTVLPSVLLLTGAAHAADIQERTLRFPSASNRGHPQVEGVEKFATSWAQLLESVRHQIDTHGGGGTR